MLQTPELRECPKCDTLNKPKEEDTMLVECKKCKLEYCLLHQNAHPMTVTCDKYETVSFYFKKFEKFCIFFDFFQNFDFFENVKKFLDFF